VARARKKTAHLNVTANSISCSSDWNCKAKVINKFNKFTNLITDTQMNPTASTSKQPVSNNNGLAAPTVTNRRWAEVSHTWDLGE
jgi:hypothetical protein